MSIAVWYNLVSLLFAVFNYPLPVHCCLLLFSLLFICTPLYTIIHHLALFNHHLSAHFFSSTAQPPPNFARLRPNLPFCIKLTSYRKSRVCSSNSQITKKKYVYQLDVNKHQIKRLHFSCVPTAIPSPSAPLLFHIQFSILTIGTMNLMNLGKVSRKTGRKAKSTVKRDSNGMDNISEYFENASSSDDDVKSDGLVRRLSFALDNGPAHRIDNDVFDPVSPPRSRPTEDLSSLEKMSPIDSKKRPGRKAASVTKEMALGRSKKRASSLSKGPTTPQLHHLLNSDSEEPDLNSHTKDAQHIPHQRSTTPRKFSPMRARPTSPPPAQSRSPSPLPPSPPPQLVQKQTKNRRLKTIISDSDSESLSTQPLRRSSRHKVAPLAFWRNERVVYKPTKQNGALVQEFNDVLHVPEPPERKRRRTSRASSAQPRNSRRNNAINNNNNNDNSTSDDESAQISKLKGSEWLKEGSLSVDVLEGPGSDREVKRVIAWSPDLNTFETRKTAEDNFSLAVLFDQDREFAAAGMLELPVQGVKLSKINEDTYFIFHLVEGIVEISVNDSSFIASKGCSFEVPLGNTYKLINKGSNVARLFFVQAKYVILDPDEEWS